MDREAKAEWRRIVPELEAVGLLTAVDHALLEAYCVTYSRWLDAHRQAKLEVTLTEKGYPVVDPMVGVEQKYLAQLKTLAAEFGMSPSARTRIHVEKDEGGSEMDELLSASAQVG
jgi:P27 family predicted phage terminase small subunit